MSHLWVNPDYKDHNLLSQTRSDTAIFECWEEGRRTQAVWVGCILTWLLLTGDNDYRSVTRSRDTVYHNEHESRSESEEVRVGRTWEASRVIEPSMHHWRKRCLAANRRYSRYDVSFACHCRRQVIHPGLWLQSVGRWYYSSAMRIWIYHLDKRPKMALPSKTYPYPDIPLS
jgi:hypothetical protein